MKTFFTQPIGQLGRQNALGFIGLNVVLLVVGFGEIDLPVGLGNFINFLWGFSLLSLILAGYYLVEDQVPKYWREASAILGGVIIVGTLIENLHQIITWIMVGLLQCTFYGLLTH